MVMYKDMVEYKRDNNMPIPCNDEPDQEMAKILEKKIKKDANNVFWNNFFKKSMCWKLHVLFSNRTTGSLVQNLQELQLV